MSHHKGPQMDMFQQFTRHRRNDPWTSKAAAAEIMATLNEKQQRVLEEFYREAKERGRGLCDYELESRCGSHGSTWRTRRSELTEMGLLRDTGITRKINGFHRQVYMLTDPAAYQSNDENS